MEKSPVLRGRSVHIIKIFIFIITCILMIKVCQYYDNRESWKGWVEVLDDGWNVTVVGNQITMETVIPDSVRWGMDLLILSHLQTVDVYIDDRLIYQYPSQDLVTGVLPGHWNFVKLPADSVGKNIRIVKVSPYKNFFSDPDLVLYGYYGNLISYIQHRQILPLLIGLGLTMIGGIIMVGAVLSSKYGNFIQQVILGITFIFAAVWICSESGVLISWIREEVQYYAMVFSAYACPVLIMIYCRLRSRKICRGVNHLLFAVSAVSGTFFALVLLGWMEFSRTLLPLHFILLAAMSCVMRIIVKDGRSETFRYTKSELFCAGVVFVAICNEMVSLYTGYQDTTGSFIQFALLLFAVNKMIAAQRFVFETIVEKTQLKKNLKISRIELMTSQIKPHFIYNTLNTIQVLIKIDPHEAERMVHYFSKYLRGNLSMMDDQHLVEFSKELDHIKAYVEIEKVRFEEKLNVVYEIETTGFSVPPLSVQPLVENAIKHGIIQKTEGGTVTVRTARNALGHIIEIIDDGVGFDTSILHKKDGYGIENIRYRIEEICHGQITIESTPGKGTKAAIFIPDTK